MACPPACSSGGQAHWQGVYARCEPGGLPVRNYGAEELVALLGGEFRLVDSELVDHLTPSGSTQQSLFAHFQRPASPGRPRGGAPA